MDFRDRIVERVADKECSRICRRVIKMLQRMTDGLQSGAWGLSNTWEEICVQAQRDQSIFWDLYVDTIRTILRPEIEALPSHLAQAIWLQTDEGFDWVFDNPKQDESPYCIDDIEKYVLHEYILTEAGRWSNARIRYYNEHAGIN